MVVIDWILNAAGLLLWLSWRSAKLGALPPASPISLVGTLRRADSRAASRWIYLVSLLGILTLRGLLYYTLGPASDWTPTIELGAVTLWFRSDRFWRIQMYSGLSFGVWLIFFYAWLLLLSAVNHRVPDTDSVQRSLRRHLGRVEPLPSVLKILLVPLLLLLLWIGLHPMLASLGVVPEGITPQRLWFQGGVISAVSLLIWEVLVVLVLGVHILHSYVFLGSWPFWQFASTTAQNLLTPLRWLPLKLGRVDLAPLLVILGVVALGNYLAEVLPRWFSSL